MRFVFLLFWLSVLRLPCLSQCDNLLSELDTTSNDTRLKEIYKILSNEKMADPVCLESVFQKFRSSPANLKYMDAVLKVFFSYSSKSDSKNTLRVGLMAWKYIKNQNGIDYKLAGLTNSLASAYINEDKLDSALYYSKISEDYFSKGEDKEQLWRPNFNRYRIYLALKNYKKADYYLNKSYSYIKDSPNRMNKGFVLHSMLVALKARGDKKIFEKYLKEYIQFKKQGKGLSDMRHLGMDDYFEDKDEGKATLERLIQSMIKDSVEAAKVSFRGLILGEMYEKDKEFEKAEKLYLELLKHNAIPQERKNYYKHLFELYKNNGETEKAFQSIEKYIAVQDSSFQQIFDGKIADYEVKYQTQEKEKEILKKDLELQEAENRQRTIIAISLFISLLGGGAFYVYQRKLKFQREMKEKDMMIQRQKIADLEQKNKLLALNSMIEGQESERLRIAQDLHDGLGGLLTTVKAHFNAIEREIANIKNMNVYEKTNQLIDEACAEVRRIAHDMVPHSLKMNGLAGVLSDIKHTVVSRGIECDVEIHQLREDLLGEQKSVMIYRIIQEVVNNALKHSHATHLLIQLVGYEEGLNVLIEDNGRGFDVNSLISGKGLGLKSIESRVKYLEGSLNIDSTPSQGTTINIDIPFKKINSLQ